jgi:16S rRNA processing protein RimM
MATRITPKPGVSPDGWVSLGVIAKPHGIRGALKLHLWNEGGHVLRPGITVRLRGATASRDAQVIEAKNGVLVVDGNIDRTIAETLQGAEVLVRRADFPADKDDDTYLIDAVGARVEDTHGHALGVIEGFTDNGAQPLASVKTPSGPSVLVPFLRPIVVSMTAKCVVLDPPPGLFNLDDALDAGDANSAADDDADDDTADE